MGKVAPWILAVIPSVLIGFGAQRWLNPDAGAGSPTERDRHRPTQIDTTPAAQLPPRPDDAAGPRQDPLQHSAVTAYAAIQHDRPIALLRYLDESTGLAEIRQVATYLIELNNPEYLPDNSAMDVLFARWVELGPDDAIEFAKRLRTRFRLGQGKEVSQAQRHFLTRFYGIWLQMDHAAATASLEAQGIPDLRDFAMRDYERGPGDGLGSKVEENFVTKAQALAADPESWQSIRSIYGPMRHWAQEDPEGALAFVRDLPAGAFRHAALNATILGLREQRPDLVIATLSDAPPSQWRTSHLIGAAGQWGKLDPEACTAWLKTLPPGLGTDAMILDAAYAMSEERPFAALALLEANGWHLMGKNAALQQQTHHSAGYSSGGYSSGIERSQVLKSILMSVAKTDPRRALRAAGELALVPAPHHHTGQPIYQRAALVNAVLEVWIESDLEAAREFIAAMPGAEKLKITNGLSWAGATPIEAAHFAATLGPGRLRDQLVQRIGGTVDTAEEFAALAGVPEEIREAIERRALRELAGQDPDVVAAQLDRLPEARVRDLLPSLIHGMQRTKGIEQTAEWLGAYPDQAQVARGYELLARRWIRNDPEATADWVHSLPPGDGQDRALAGLSDHLSLLAGQVGGKNDYPLALEWAGKISNPERRDKTVEQAFVHWHRAEPQAAQRALDEAALSPELTARIRAKMGGGG